MTLLMLKHVKSYGTIYAKSTVAMTTREKRSRFYHLLNTIAPINHKLKAELDVLRLPSIDGAQIRALATFRLRIQNDCASIRASRVQCETQIAEQRRQANAVEGLVSAPAHALADQPLARMRERHRPVHPAAPDALLEQHRRDGRGGDVAQLVVLG